MIKCLNELVCWWCGGNAPECGTQEYTLGVAVLAVVWGLLFPFHLWAWDKAGWVLGGSNLPVCRRTAVGLKKSVTLRVLSRTKGKGKKCVHDYSAAIKVRRNRHTNGNSSKVWLVSLFLLGVRRAWKGFKLFLNACFWLCFLEHR